MTISTETTAPNLEDLPLEDAAAAVPKGGLYYTDEDLPPLRMNAARVEQRLSASVSSINPVMINFRRKSIDFATRSRSRSPSLKDYGDASSSVSSLDDLDSDILTDRMGLEELERETRKQLEGSVSSLTPVSERLSEATLEDIHAFTDIQKGPSRCNSIATNDVNSVQLETLDECDDEEDLEEKGYVHISNMENLTIEEEEVTLGGDASVPTDTANASAAGASLPTQS